MKEVRALAPKFRLRTGSVHGVKHAKLGTNNQDAILVQEFGIPRWGTNYQVGLISDGCSGLPAFTHSEVGSNLMVVNCLARIQELILGGASMEEIPMPLYHSVTNFMRNLANTIMPANIHWPFGIQFRGSNVYRDQINANRRFTIDYLAATMAGFIDDGTTLVVFRADDGVVSVNDELFIVDQNNQPDYPALSINAPGGGFKTSVYASADVTRLCLATDGLKELLTVDELGLPGAFFECDVDNPMGLQYALNRLRKEYGDKMGDDCTVLTRERLEV
jgi:hypothetical protein